MRTVREACGCAYTRDNKDRERWAELYPEHRPVTEQRHAEAQADYRRTVSDTAGIHADAQVSCA